MEVIDTTTRNSIWKRLSRNVSKGKIGEFVRAVNKVFKSIKICRKESEAQLPTPVSSAFVYPDDRYLCNDEILRQLEVLERRFNQQTDILVELNISRKPSRTMEIFPLMSSLILCPLSFAVATIRPARYTEERFAELEKLVQQVKERRQRLDGERSKQQAIGNKLDHLA